MTLRPQKPLQLGLTSIHLCNQVECTFNQLLSGSNWKAKALFVILILGIFRAFPSYDALDTPFTEATWRSAQLKFDHPLLASGRFFPLISHEGKLTFRLTVPVLAHLLHLGRNGILILSAILGGVLLFTVLTLAYEITCDRQIAFLLTLATACTWSGLTAFHDLRGGYYDAIALCLLLAAMSARSPILVGIAAFLASWADERAFIALPLLIAFFVFKARLSKQRLTPPLTALILAGVAYLVTRGYLTVTQSYSLNTAGIGLTVLLQQARVLPLGIWAGIGGGWILLVYSLWILWRAKQYLALAGLMGAVIPLIGTAAIVSDITRSAAYCLPAVIVALAVLRAHVSLRGLSGLVLAVTAISFLVPTAYCEGTHIFWLYPLPVQLIRWL